MDSSASGSAPGWFGKLPMLGDFAHRRLPSAVLQRCDDWLSQCVARSRAALGDAWMDRYLTAPLWAFAWAPRVVDDSWWVGVLMPSVDAVGRYFPLLLAQASGTPPADAAASSALDAWYAAAARQLLATLSTSIGVDEFEASLEALGTPWGTSDAPSFASLPDPAGRSFWWPLLPDGSREPSRRGTPAIVEGLPSPDRYASMLDGHL